MWSYEYNNIYYYTILRDREGLRSRIIDVSVQNIKINKFAENKI